MKRPLKADLFKSYKSDIHISDMDIKSKEIYFLLKEKETCMDLMNSINSNLDNTELLELCSKINNIILNNKSLKSVKEI